jgi:predicted Zn finger-like uncharacterized protein
MVITCEKCSIRFNLDESLIKKEGSKVRCSQCKHVFMAYPTVPSIKPLERGDDIDEAMEPDEDLGLDETEELEEFRLDDDFDEELEPGELDLNFDLGDDLQLELEEEPAGTEPDKDLERDEELEQGELDLEFDLGDDLELDLGEQPAGTEPDEDLELDKEPEMGELDLGEEFESGEPELDNDLELYDELEFELEDGEDYDISPLEAPDGEDAKEDDSEFNLELDVDLDLNLDMDPHEPAGIAPTADTDEPDEELDLAEFDEMLEEQEELEEQVDLLEMDVPEENEMEPEEAIELETSEETPEPEPPAGDQEPAKEIAIEPAPPLDYGIEEDFKKPVTIGKPVLILLLLAILALGGYSACIMYGIEIPYLSTIKIPFLSDYLNPQPTPPVPVRLAPEKKSVNGRFVTNTSAGTLFVITGRVVNTSEVPCSHIEIKGTLITTEKVKAKEKTVYCGNLIPEEQLKSLEMTAIDTQFAKLTGNNQSNVNIKPGRSVPFMIVFSDLPDNLENFTVNVAGFERKTQDN